MRSFTLGNIPRPEFDCEIFSAGKPMDLEIGAGQGLHAIQYSTANPNRILLAAERTHARFSSLEQRKRNHPELTNLMPIHSDVEALVAYHIPDSALEKIFLLYPNPYPKKKQANLRWHNQPFMEVLLRKLKPSGSLTLATNLTWYAQEAETIFSKTWNLHLESKAPITPEDSPRTHFEKKYLSRGEICWNLEFRKVQ